jgi:hypothetical protein
MATRIGPQALAASTNDFKWGWVGVVFNTAETTGSAMRPPVRKETEGAAKDFLRNAVGVSASSEELEPTGTWTPKV